MARPQSVALNSGDLASEHNMDFYKSAKPKTATYCFEFGLIKSMCTFQLLPRP